MDPGNIDFNAVGDMLSSLSQEDMESLSRMASQLFGSGEEKREGEREEADRKGKNRDEDEKSGFYAFRDMLFDSESMMKIISVMNRLKNQPEDDRVRLLYALRPMLSPERRHRVDQAAEMIKIMSVLPLLKQ